MTEHKYTDEEVIKALECCAKLDYNDWSICANECPYNKCCYDEKKGINFLKDVLALINRQKAEIERLNAEKDNLIKTYKECMVEAIKEFAEKLGAYEEVVTTLKDGENIVAIDVHHLHRLVKEMTGENNQ